MLIGAETFFELLSVGSSAVETVHCDKATNFVGASRQFLQLRARIEEEADAIHEFAFIPPRAPHFGGLWEAGVKSANHLLLRTVGSLLLTAEELQATLVAVEAVLNSRPLGAISEDLSDGEALTPGHLLQQFWRRWSKEYVLGLQVRSKWHRRLPNVVVGELVVVAEDNLPPQQWLNGRVTEVHAGEDGVVRVAELISANLG
ncbi:uncharacterized protein LOC135441070 [Drosophila montana]|uniref:uncharacterized protein LOC135441070 n=1 Tax=Drosophila montana TaxID=40370 RepID=UPI00313DF177